MCVTNSISLSMTRTKFFLQCNHSSHLQKPQIMKVSLNPNNGRRKYKVLSIRLCQPLSKKKKTNEIHTHALRFRCEWHTSVEIRAFLQSFCWKSFSFDFYLVACVRILCLKAQIPVNPILVQAHEAHHEPKKSKKNKIQKQFHFERVAKYADRNCRTLRKMHCECALSFRWWGGGGGRHFHFFIVCFVCDTIQIGACLIPTSCETFSSIAFSLGKDKTHFAQLATPKLQRNTRKRFKFFSHSFFVAHFRLSSVVISFFVHLTF